MNDCIDHPGLLDRQGYGRVSKGGRTRFAYRIAWEAVNGPVPQGYELHHVCERKQCVNVAHLELVTRSQHQRLHRRKPYCKNGHEMTPGNTYTRLSGGFDCRACIRDRAKRYRASVAA